MEVGDAGLIVLSQSNHVAQTNLLFWTYTMTKEFKYRHVMLPMDIAKLVPKTHLMSESKWRKLGVQQNQGWVR